MNAIRQRVEAGAGLLILGGWHSYDAGGYADTPLGKIFPVQLRQVVLRSSAMPPKILLFISRVRKSLYRNDHIR